MLKSDEISTGRAALILGVSARTVLRWGDSGLLGPVTALESGHRRYSRAAVIAHKEAQLAEDSERVEAAKAESVAS